MSDQYLLHFPDGTEYGPIDRATLEEWHQEGRIPAEALVWPDGAPEWLPVEEVLSAERSEVAAAVGAALDAVTEAPSSSAARTPAAALEASEPDTQPPAPARPPAAPTRRGGLSGRARALLLVGGGIALVVALLGGLWAVLQPTLARRTAIAAIEGHALADRRLDDRALGFVVDLPPGWVALRDDNPFVVTRGARLRVAHPALGAFGAVRAEAHPELMGDLDRHIDAVLRDRRPTQPSLEETARSDIQLGRGRGRLVRTSWDEGVERLQGATAAWVDGYEYYWLQAWAPATAGDKFLAAFNELMRAVAPSGTIAGRVDEAAERLSLEVPELSSQALRLLIGERMSRGESLETVPVDALRAVSRGLEALTAAEAEEMGQIYGQVWDPVSPAERRRLALILERVKAGQPVAPVDVRALREAVKTGVVELPPEQRDRLQELSGRALEKSLLLR